MLELEFQPGPAFIESLAVLDCGSSGGIKNVTLASCGGLLLCGVIHLFKNSRYRQQEGWLVARQKREKLSDVRGMTLSNTRPNTPTLDRAPEDVRNWQEEQG